ncbi:MAG: hypothetical protein ACLQU4_16150 [Limisphaerales bacterium]
MKKLLTISAVVLVAMSVLGDFIQDNLVQDGLRKHISQMCLVYNGVEFQKGRRVLATVLDTEGSREKVVVVLFSMEFIDGGNFDYQFISVLKGSDTDFGMLRPIFFQKIGGKGVRYITSMVESQGTVLLSGLEYGTKDSMASPSVPCAFRLDAEGGVISLKRMKPIPNPQVGTNGRQP